MKKLISIALALVLVLSMSTVAFAEEVAYTASDATTFNTIVKSYTSENSVQVSETLSFTSTPDDDNPDDTNLTVNDLVVSDGLENLPITVNIPSYNQVGVYKYTISEDGENTAGVTYTDSVIRVVVMIEYDNENQKLVIGNLNSYILKVGGEKTNEFKNEFKSGSFSVAKKVTGNMANQNDEFEITVTLTRPADKVIGTPITVAGQTVNADQWVNGVYTTTLTLSHADGATTFSNIPVGVTVTVSENKADDKMNGYTYVSTQIGEEDFTSLTIADDTDSAIVVTNNKSTNVDTGINMDSMPYILLLAVACIGLVFFFSKKRMMREN